MDEIQHRARVSSLDDVGVSERSGVFTSRRRQEPPTPEYPGSALSTTTLTALHDAGFDLEDAVAAGGFGVVYRARDRRLQRDVAIKVLDLRAVKRVGMLTALEEIRMLATIRHAHIVPLYEAGGVGDGLLYLVMPWIEGASLRQRLRERGARPLTEVLRIGIDLADALSAMHQRGLVHRDVKPENVLLDGDHAMIIDFGLVTAVRAEPDASLTDEVLVGTPIYMSPEQWVRGGALDGRADVFGLGCTLYELLAGQKPWEPRSLLSPKPKESRHSWSTTVQTMEYADDYPHAISRKPPSLRKVRSDVPASIDRLLQRAMAPERDQRMASAMLFRDALQQIQAGLLNKKEARTTRRTMVLAAVALAIALPSAIDYGVARAEEQRLLALNPTRLLLTGVLNTTGDRRYDSVASAVSAGLDEALARQLQASAAAPENDSVSGVTVVKAPVETVTSDLVVDPVNASRALAIAEGAGVVVITHMVRDASGVMLRGAVIDARLGKQRVVLPPTPVSAAASEAELRAVAASLVGGITSSLRPGAGPSLQQD
jgi:serine/threonine protein kinase